jgi:hypothetical protein
MIVASPILAGPNNENEEVSGRLQKVVSGLGPGDRGFCCLNIVFPVPLSFGQNNRDFFTIRNARRIGLCTSPYMNSVHCINM